MAASAVSVAALDDARPADTLCFVIDGYDPVPGGRGGISRSAREIAALRRTHDLRRMIALLGERLPPALARRGRHPPVSGRGERSDDDDPAPGARGQRRRPRREDGGFLAGAALLRRWQAGESDVATSLAHPRWLAPPPGVSGVVVHELRGGVAAPPR